MPHNTLGIMFVCHGNICRSPMAEFVMKQVVAEAGLQDAFTICSSATSTEEIGHDIHRGTKAVLDAHGVPYSRRAAVRLKRSDSDLYDQFIGMDSANVRNMRSMLSEKAAPHIHLLSDYGGNYGDVADPWYTGDFETTYDDIESGCIALLAFLTQGRKL